MIKLGQYILIVVLSCVLLACASARMAEEVQSGKATFNSGNFKQAFAELMPLAVKGNCEAQYAIGYMYYYGLGVEPHKESGIFWIKQSADQMYRPAIKAMKMLEKNFKPCPAPVFKSKKQAYSENDLSEKLLEPEIQKKLAEIKKENKPHENPVRMAAKATPENKADDILMSLPRQPNKTETKKVIVAENHEPVKEIEKKDSIIKSIKTTKEEPTNKTETKKVIVAEKQESAKEIEKKDLIVKSIKITKAEPKKEIKNKIIKQVKRKDLEKKVTKMVKGEVKKKDNAESMKEVNNKKTTSLKIAMVEKNKFTLQLFGSYALSDVKKLQQQLKLQDKTEFAHTQFKGRDWYVLAYGKYSALNQAKLAKNDMPSYAQQLHPWIRNTDELHWIS